MEYTEGKKQAESYHMKRETLELVRNFSSAPPEVQRQFLSLVKSIVSVSEKSGAAKPKRARKRA